TAEQQEVDAQREAVERQQEVLAPAADVAELQSLQPVDRLAAVAGHFADALAGELRRLLLEDDDGRAFGHARKLAADSAKAREARGSWKRRRLEAGADAEA